MFFFGAAYSHSKALVPSCACMSEASESSEMSGELPGLYDPLPAQPGPFCDVCPTRNQREGMFLLQWSHSWTSYLRAI